MHFSTIEFGSLLSYSPRGISDAEKRSRTMMRSLKNDEFLIQPLRSPILTSNFISEIIEKNITTLPFADFFKTKPILVPIPNSTLTRPETLWVPQRLANALIRKAFGKDVIEYVKRVRSLPKAATSLAENRPKTSQHYNSLEIQKIFSEPPKEIVLVDDIVTRGATILGTANKLADAFPKAHIRGFAVMRTISPPFHFNNIYDPCIGTITINGNETFRRP